MSTRPGKILPLGESRTREGLIPGSGRERPSLEDTLGPRVGPEGALGSCAVRGGLACPGKRNLVPHEQPLMRFALIGLWIGLGAVSLSPAVADATREGKSPRE